MTTRTARALMAFCMLGALVLLMGAEGGSLNQRRKDSKGPHADSKGKNSDVDLVNLILDPRTMTGGGPLRDLSNDSVSPWETRYTHDENRLPQRLANAKCLLKGCRNAEGREVMDFESKPIFQQIMVLKRVEMDNARYAFKLEAETIAIGCTCVSPTVLRQQ